MDHNGLLEGVRNGNPAAWNALVEAVGDRLFRAACLLCDNDSDAQDAVQETFLRFARGLSRFRGDSSLHTWLHGILLNVMRERWRESARMIVTDTPPEPEARADDSGRALDTQVVAGFLIKALRKLTPEHRVVLTMRYYDQLPVAEIAARLDISAGTVKSRLFHARQQMSVWVPKTLNPFSSGSTE